MITDRSSRHPFVIAIDWATALPRRKARVIAIIMLAAISSLDFLVGPGVSFVGFYLLALCFVGWTLGEKSGLPAAAFCVVSVILCNGFGDGKLITATTLPLWAIGWNCTMRLFVNSMAVLLVGGFRRCFDQQRLLARRDPLTGLLNKRAFFEDARSSLAHAHRLGHCAVLAYVDLDGFKQVNDHFGHAAGDAVLRGFAEGAIGKLRRYDLAGRIGGDEFVFLLTAPSDGTALTVAERVHANLSGCLVDAPCPVTCSTGAIIIRHPGVQDGEALTKLADALMYDVKRAGKDAIRIAILDADADHMDVAMPPFPSPAMIERRRAA